MRKIIVGVKIKTHKISATWNGVMPQKNCSGVFHGEMNAMDREASLAIANAACAAATSPNVSAKRTASTHTDGFFALRKP